MYQGKSEIAVPRNKNIIRGPSRSPKGLGRRNPHSSAFTRKSVKSSSGQAINISNGLDKISLFFTGKQIKRKPVILKLNPFKKMIESILKFTK